MADSNYIDQDVFTRLSDLSHDELQELIYKYAHDKNRVMYDICCLEFAYRFLD